MTPYYSEVGIELYHGDCRAVLPALPENRFDTCITDPPYHLTANKNGGTGPATLNLDSPAGRSRIGTGFMGKAWDGGDVAFRPETWAAVLRVCKPGAILMAFGGTRTWHRLACAIEDAGWELRDTICWLYGQGFPKSLNFGCKCQGNTVPYDHEEKADSEAEHNVRPVRERDVSEAVNADAKRGEVLLAGVSEQGASSLWAARSKSESGGGEQSGVEGRELHRAGEGLSNDSDARTSTGASERLRSGTSRRRGKDTGPTTRAGRGSASQEREASGQPADESGSVRGPQCALDSESLAGGDCCPTCGGVKAFTGYGSALKPAWEPIIVAMKPLDGTFAENAKKWGVAGLNIDGGRIAHDEPVKPATRRFTSGQLNRRVNDGRDMEQWEKSHSAEGKPQIATASALGRFPANVVLDEEAARQLDASTDELKGGASINRNRTEKTNAVYGKYGVVNEDVCYGDSGGASRFFYTAKASRSDRGHSNTHPTVKPTDLIKYICKLTATPTGGEIIDPFGGSMTTLVAAREVCRRATAIELELDHCRIGVDRLRQGMLFTPARS